MKDRIYQIMKESGMNQKEFSQATKIATATLSNIFNGRTSATLNHARAIHERFPELRIEWLIFGEGEMYDSPKNLPESPVQKLMSPTSFDGMQKESLSAENNVANELTCQSINHAVILDTVKEVAKQIAKPQRNVVEIRVFFDDGTYDVFEGSHK